MKNAEFYILAPYSDRNAKGILIVKNTEVPDAYEYGKEVWQAILFWGLKTDPLFQDTIHIPTGSDADVVAQCALDFFTLKAGDTDADYFDDYTPEQLSWRDEHADAVGAMTENIAEYRVV